MPKVEGKDLPQDGKHPGCVWVDSKTALCPFLLGADKWQIFRQVSTEPQVQCPYVPSLHMVSAEQMTTKALSDLPLPIGSANFVDHLPALGPLHDFFLPGAHCTTLPTAVLTWYPTSCRSQPTHSHPLSEHFASL